MMKPGRVELPDGLWLDARRAVWIAPERCLAVADLHLGYAWAHRHAGQMLPVSARDDSAGRLLALQADYRPRWIVLLGDVVHRALPLPAIESELKALLDALTRCSAVSLIAGNHDRSLQPLLDRCGIDANLSDEIQVGPHRLLHGDEPGEDEAGNLLMQARNAGGRIIFGHEHPAVAIGDGTTSAARCPAFLASSRALILPAFSNWSAGTVTGRGDFLSPLARQARMDKAYAIMGTRILEMPYP